MPGSVAAAGLHSPITNIPSTESTISAARISHGSIGSGAALAIASDAVIEPVPRVQFEAAARLTAPDTKDLLDIGAASFGVPAQLESVLGSDERVRITNTTQFPWRATASLLITAADNSSWIGTAWFISPRTLATAGHCVYIKHSGVPGRDGWVKRIQVMPGRNGAELPFGGASATEFWTVRGWGEQGMEIYDYGAIILQSPFAEDLGSMSFGVFDDGTLQDATANIAGYPSDKESGTLWYDFRKIANVNADKVFYAADTAGGQSGACVYMLLEGERIGIAIHAYGGNTANSGTRISSQVFTNLESWKRS